MHLMCRNGTMKRLSIDTVINTVKTLMIEDLQYTPRFYQLFNKKETHSLRYGLIAYDERRYTVIENCRKILVHLIAGLGF